MKICEKMLLLMIFWFTGASAGLYPVPMTIKRVEGIFPRQEVVWTAVDLPQADAPAPIGFWFGSANAIPGSQFSIVQNETCEGDLCSTKVIPGETISSAAMRAFKKGPSTIRYSDAGNGYGNCVAFGGIPQGSERYNAAIFPAGCAEIPPPRLYCFIVTPLISLNHGSINLKEANGSKASATVNISCSEANNVKLSLSNKQTYVPLNNDAKANILINNKQPGQQHTLPQGFSSFTVTSELEGISEGGEYQGTAVLIIEPV